MAVFQYKALDTGGRESAGIIDADSPQDARRKLRDSGLFPTEMTEGAAKGILSEEVKVSRVLGRSTSAQVALFTRQLAVLLEAGMPLVEALSAILDQIDDKRLVNVLYEVREKVNRGTTLADALSNHSKIFSSLYCNMVKAGESSGALETILFRLADFAESRQKLAKRIRASLAYPTVMVVFGTSIVIFLMSYVVPRVTQIFVDMGQSLPSITRLLISVCNFIRGYWWLMLVSLAALIGILRAYVGTPGGRWLWDDLKLKLPVFGDLVRKVCVARFARTLGTLLEGGLPLMIALDIVKDVVGNKALEKAIDEAKTGVRKGQDVAIPLKQSKVFPSMVIHMISLGERSGQLDKMLMRVADAYEDEVTTSIDTLVSMLEPLMIVVMGVVVGFLVMAILLPIFNLSRLASH